MPRDYSDYYVRLTSYTQWAGDANVYVKELVEAGFVYSGENDTVFCFKCGVTANEWREHHRPIERHEQLNRACAFLVQRSKNIVGGEQKPSLNPPPPLSLEEYEKKEILFEWIPGKGAFPQKPAEQQQVGVSGNEPEQRNDIVEP